MKHPNRWLVAAALVALVVSAQAEAQWVFLARRVVGRVESMSQQTDTGTLIDTATVIVDRPVDRVYQTVRRSLASAQQTQGITLKIGDDVGRVVQFKRGDQTASIRVSELGDDLSQLLVTSSRPAATTADKVETSGTSIIVQRILAICKDMDVHCSEEKS
jgi:hypothetical protein